MAEWIKQRKCLNFLGKLSLKPMNLVLFQTLLHVKLVSLTNSGSLLRSTVSTKLKWKSLHYVLVNLQVFKVTIFYCKVLFFVLASYKLKNPDKFEFSRKINKIVVHPNFNPLTLNSNIALLKLPSELPFGNVSAHVSAICLPAMERDIDEQANLIKIATISGWNKQKVVEELLTANVTILKQSECVVPAKSVTQENICSRGQLSTGLACNHFNGEPLITYDNLKNQWQLIGVASFSECSTFPVPNVYTRVSKYLDWIMKTMSEN